MKPARAPVVYVDVDETLVRNYGTSRIPMPQTIAHVRDLFAQGAELYCWSSGGADYARGSAEALGIEGCFRGFLPKPEVLLDDQKIADWKRLLYVHPNNCEGRTAQEYQKQLGS